MICKFQCGEFSVDLDLNKEEPEKNEKCMQTMATALYHMVHKDYVEKQMADDMAAMIAYKEKKDIAAQ